MNKQRLIIAICILSTFIGLYSCNAQFHIQKAEKHREKALKKGAIFEDDTVFFKGDTVLTTLTRNDTTFITKTITNTVEVAGEVRYITRKDKRVLKRKERKEDKRRFKLEKIEKKGEAKAKKNKSNWLLFMILGGALALFIRFFLVKHLFKVFGK